MCARREALWNEARESTEAEKKRLIDPDHDDQTRQITPAEMLRSTMLHLKREIRGCLSSKDGLGQGGMVT